MQFFERVPFLLATGCLVGKFPLAPGTLGSAMGLLLWVPMAGRSLPGQFLALVR